MPTYEYACKKCHHHFDAFQSIASKPLTVCPMCKGELERVISGGVGLIFKGSGFYITDYKKGNGGNPSTKTTSTSAATTETKSD